MVYAMKICDVPQLYNIVRTIFTILDGKDTADVTWSCEINYKFEMDGNWKIQGGSAAPKECE